MRRRRAGAVDPVGGRIAPFTFWIVNRDAGLAGRWETALRRESWEVTRAEDPATFLASAGSNGVGLALMDWRCLGASPLAALRSLKVKAPGVSIILTSEPDISNDQIIETLEAGVDDFFPNALDEGLMKAKLRAHLRRLLPSFASALDIVKSKSGDIKLDRARWELWLRGRGGKMTLNTDLTRTEMQLLGLFLARPGAVLERRFIVETLWKDESENIQQGTVDKHIESVRRKLGKLGSRIQTVYGVGYAFREES